MSSSPFLSFVKRWASLGENPNEICLTGFAIFERMDAWMLNESPIDLLLMIHPYNL